MFLSSWLRQHCNKKQINRRKTNRSLITCILPIYIQDTKENSLVTPPNGSGYQVKYHLQLKTKENVGWCGEAGSGRFPGKIRVNKGKFVMQI